MSFLSILKDCVKVHQQTADEQKAAYWKGWYKGAAEAYRKTITIHRQYPAKVTIDVRGGVAYLRRQPRGVIVEIIDHDNEGG